MMLAHAGGASGTGCCAMLPWNTRRHSLNHVCCPSLPPQGLTAVFGCNSSVMVVRGTSASALHLPTTGPRVGSFVQGAPGKWLPLLLLALRVCDPRNGVLRCTNLCMLTQGMRMSCMRLGKQHAVVFSPLMLFIYR